LELISDAQNLAAEIKQAIMTEGVTKVKVDGVEEEVFAYEVDGFGTSVPFHISSLRSLDKTNRINTHYG